MEIQVKVKFLRMSPKKVRLVTGLIKTLDAQEALTRLEFVNKAATQPVVKLLKSALSNATENNKLDKNNLFIKEVRVDGGPTLKRWMPKAFGRATPLRKRSSHITLVLAEKVPTKQSAPVKKVDSKDDVVKIENIDELKALSHDSKDDKTLTDDQSGGKKNNSKGFVNKMFSRRSGEK